MLGAAMAWCFGVVFLGGGLDGITESIFGKNLHMNVGAGMGALIAGASLASLPYSTDVLGKVSAVKDFFVTLFFVGLGMGIPMPDGVAVLGLALILCLTVIAARYLVFFPLLYFTGLDRRNAFVSSTRLAQISEFSLVIAYLGVGLGHLTAEINSVIIFSFVITALLTPILFKAADDLHRRAGPLLSALGFKLPQTEIVEQEKTYKLVLLGYHRFAASLLEALYKSVPHLMEDTLVIDFNVSGHHHAAKHGVKVRYGDLANTDSFSHFGLDKANVIAIAVTDDLLKGTSNAKLLQALRRINPKATIIANAIDVDEAHRLYKLTADFVYMPHVTGAEGLMPAVCSALIGGLKHYRSQQEAGRPYAPTQMPEASAMEKS